MPLRPRRRPSLSRAAAPRQAPPSLAGYVAAAGALAVVLTGGLVLIDLRGRGSETLQPEPPPMQAPTPRPDAHAAAAPVPAAPAAAPPPAPAPPAPAAPALPAAEPSTQAAAAPPPPEPPLPAADSPAEPPVDAPAEPPAGPRPETATAALGHWVVESPRAPMQCLPERIRGVLTELAQAVGEVEIVSTTELHTDNHSPGSVRAKMHADCKAVDLRVRGKLAEAVAHLRAQPELGAVQSYRNGVIHLDFEPRGAERSAAPAREAPRHRTRAARAEPAEALPPPEPAPAPAPSPFAPVARPDIVR